METAEVDWNRDVWSGVEFRLSEWSVAETMVEKRCERESGVF